MKVFMEYLLETYRLNILSGQRQSVGFQPLLRRFQVPVLCSRHSESSLHSSCMLHSSCWFCATKRTWAHMKLASMRTGNPWHIPYQRMNLIPKIKRSHGQFQISVSNKWARSEQSLYDRSPRVWLCMDGRKRLKLLIGQPTQKLTKATRRTHAGE